MKSLLKLLFILLPFLNLTAQVENNKIETAIFAGGCFWCVQPVFENVPGILSSIAGYTGGHVDNPTYEKVSHENTGHYESVEITFDPSMISYEAILQLFWKNVDPLDAKGQFCDRGDSYRSAIFYTNDTQKELAEKSKSDVEKLLNAKVATEILPASKFFPAEEYHQYYHKKNPIRYKFYRTRCGRDKRLKEVWGKVSL